MSVWQMYTGSSMMEWAGEILQTLHCSRLLELCAQNRNPEGVTEDLKDQVTSISGCWSFAFSFADALELHRT